MVPHWKIRKKAFLGAFSGNFPLLDNLRLEQLRVTLRIDTNDSPTVILNVDWSSHSNSHATM